MTYFSLKPSDGPKKKTQTESGHIFSDEAMQNIIDFGNVLYGIRKRMISEGWKIDHKKGIWISPEGVSYTKETLWQHDEDVKAKAKAARSKRPKPWGDC